jgi:hypothetical protein
VTVLTFRVSFGADDDGQSMSNDGGWFGCTAFWTADPVGVKSNKFGFDGYACKAGVLVEGAGKVSSMP